MKSSSESVVRYETIVKYCAELQLNTLPFDPRCKYKCLSSAFQVVPSTMSIKFVR